MPATYYLGFTADGRAVGRKSNQDYGYTHCVTSTGSGLPTFSTSAAGAERNAQGTRNEGGELVQVRVVDAKTYNAAMKPSQAPAVDIEAHKGEMLQAAAQVPHSTREGWLMAFTQAARVMFREVGTPLPQGVRVSIGHPSKGVRSKVIGECWASVQTADGACEIFIRPTLQDNASRVADVLTHELIHAALGHEEGHGPKFRKAMKLLGLEGKATATVAGPDWHRWADPILEALGPLPGATFSDGAALAGGKKTQTTRYLKVSCSMCDWQARVTRKHIEGRTLSCPDTECEGHLEEAA